MPFATSLLEQGTVVGPSAVTCSCQDLQHHAASELWGVCRPHRCCSVLVASRGANVELWLVCNHTLSEACTNAVSRNTCCSGLQLEALRLLVSYRPLAPLTSLCTRV